VRNRIKGLYVFSPDRRPCKNDDAKRLREQAELLPHGGQRDAVEKKARQAETGSHISDWLRSPGLRAPQ
jgi:hypothetical protein